MNKNEYPMDEASLTAMKRICQAIAAAGYDPYSQLVGYLTTGDDAYITRQGKARSSIASIKKKHIQIYMNQYYRR